MAIPHPIPYQGSKRNLAAAIMRYFPQDVNRLIEPFVGSAALSLAAADTGKANHFVLNDINAPLIHLWDWLIHKPQLLAKMYERLWKLQAGQERTFYDRVRERFNQSHQPYYLLYLLARCVKASVRYNANGEFNQSPDNRRKGRHPKAMRQDILTASNLLNGKVTLMSEDYRDCLRVATSTDIIYMDPPYQGVCANRDPRYIEGVSFDEFVITLESLNVKDISYLVSYDGRTGTTNFGKPLPNFLQLKRIELDAGRSSQATLLGRKATTYESLYLSPALVHRLELGSTISESQPQQLSILLSA